jgi:predicted XRE-type DNA-binding protein
MSTRRTVSGTQRKPPARSVPSEVRETSTKTVLAAQLNKLIELRQLSQIEAGSLIGMTQPKVSQIRRYRLKNISLERLMQALISLNQHVEIVIRPAQESDRPTITVAA